MAAVKAYYRFIGLPDAEEAVTMQAMLGPHRQRTLQRMMAQLGHAVPKVKPVLEVNGDHPLIGKLRVLHLEHAGDPRLGWCARVLLGQAQLADAGELAEPEAYNQAVAELMLRAV